MSDGKKRRKFKCPNCDHIVKFQVDPEKTLIACDHCGQLTRVTMKTSEASDVDATPSTAAKQEKNRSGATKPVSQAFDDLDLDGLDDRDSVASNTLGQNSKGQRSNRTAPKQNRRSRVSSDATADKQSSSNPTDPEVHSTGKKLTDPSNTTTESSLPNHQQPATSSTASTSRLGDSSPPIEGFSHRPPQAFSNENTPIRFLNPNDQESSAESNLTNENQDDPSSKQVRPNTFGFFRPDEPQYISEPEDDDIEFADPIAGETGGPEPEEELLTISDDGGLVQIDSTLDSSQQEDVRIICRVCDTLSYFPPADYYVCQDCYSKIDQTGAPIKRDSGPRSTISSDGPKDEIDDLISTAIGESPTQESIWQAKPTATEDDLIEDTTGLLEEDLDLADERLPESSQADRDQDAADDDELRLAPLDDPTEEYRKSVLPHGHETDLVENHQSKPDKQSIASEAEDNPEAELVDLPEIVPESEVESVENEYRIKRQNESAIESAEQDINADESEADQTTIGQSSTDQARFGEPKSQTNGCENLNDDIGVPESSLETTGELEDGQWVQQVESPQQSGLSLPDAEESNQSEIEEESSKNDQQALPNSHSDPLLDPANLPKKAAPPVVQTTNQRPIPPPFVEHRIERSENREAQGIADANAEDQRYSTAPGGTTAYSAPNHNPSNQPRVSETNTHQTNSANSNDQNQLESRGRHASMATGHQAPHEFGNRKTEPQTDHLVSHQTSPLEYGWFGDLTVLYSTWVIIGSLMVSGCLAIFLTAGFYLLAADVHWVARTISGLGVTLFVVPTILLWIWLFSLIVDKNHDKQIASLFDMARLATHGVRLSICFLLWLPGLVIGALTGFPIFGILVALFYTSPVALYVCVLSQLAGRPVVLYDPKLINLAARHQDICLTGIGVLGLSILLASPIFVLASYIPFPGIFLASPTMVALSVVLALQVSRISETIRLLQDLSADRHHNP